MLLEDERLDDLEYKKLMIIQCANGYCFTSDAVIFANSISVKHGDKIVDIGTGSGIIAIILAAKTQASKIVGIELQKRLANMAQRSVQYNNLQDIINIVNCDIKDATKIIGSGYDIVVTNPPYLPPSHVITTPSEQDICKFEINTSLQQIVDNAAKLLKFGGKFYLINKVERLADIIVAMRNAKIEPKYLTYIQPKATKPIDTVIVEGKLGGKSGLKIRDTIIVYNEDGSYTSQARSLYSK